MKGRTARRKAIWRYNEWACTRRYESLALPCVIRQHNREAMQKNGYYHRLVNPVYTVYRRSDGYVQCVAEATAEKGIARLQPYRDLTFEVLGHVTNWPAAHALIQHEREKMT